MGYRCRRTYRATLFGPNVELPFSYLWEGVEGIFLKLHFNLRNKMKSTRYTEQNLFGPIVVPFFPHLEVMTQVHMEQILKLGEG